MSGGTLAPWGKSMLAGDRSGPISFAGAFRSTDVDEARVAISDVFSDHELDVTGRRPRFDAIVAAWDIGALRIGNLRHGANVVIRPGKLGSSYGIQIPVKGSAVTRQGATTAESGPRVATVLSPAEEITMRWTAEYELLGVTILRERLERELERILGHEIDAPVRFDLAMDLSSRGATACSRRCASSARAFAAATPRSRRRSCRAGSRS